MSAITPAHLLYLPSRPEGVQGLVLTSRRHFGACMAVNFLASSSPQLLAVDLHVVDAKKLDMPGHWLTMSK